MSLINEALKRAEAEKSGTPLPRPSSTSSYGADRLGLRRPGFPTRKLIAVSAVGLLAALSAWLVMDKFSSWITTPASPATAQAAAGQHPGAKPVVGQSQVPGNARPDFADSPAAKPLLSPSDFKLSAILHGPNGATAIINGQFLQIGSMIEEATIISIGQHKVILDANGRRVTLQM
jgi:hypothetical protein